MPDASSLLLFVAAGLLLNLTPGPDVLYIIGRSLAQGRMAGVVSALGIAAGCLVHVAAAAFGLSALLAAVPVAMTAIRWAGSAYLLWLGVCALTSRSELHGVTAAPAPLSQIFRQGAVTNVLNPKVAMFFVAFLPQFTDPARGPVAGQLLVLGLVFIANGLLVCIAYALAAGWMGETLHSRQGAAQWLQRVMGATFIGLGLRLALGDTAAVRGR